MSSRCMIWIAVGCGCVLTATLLPLIRFSHTYTATLRAAKVPLLATAALCLVAGGVFADTQGRRAVGLTIGLLGLYVASGATVYLPGAVAMACSTVLLSVAVLRLFPLALQRD